MPAALWTIGRALRGLLHTARRSALLGALGSLGVTSLARAQPAKVAEARAAADGAGWTRRLALSHFERAARLEARGDIAQALREYSESIAIDSTLGQAYAGLGALRERMGDLREAELVYSEGVRLGDARARTLLLRSHLQRARGLRAEARTDLEASVELEPTRAALEELGRDYVETQAWPAALATFRRIESAAEQSGELAAAEAARLEARALRVLAAETDPSSQRVKKHDWVGRALSSIARR